MNNPNEIMLIGRAETVLPHLIDLALMN